MYEKTFMQHYVGLCRSFICCLYVAGLCLLYAGVRCRLLYADLSFSILMVYVVRYYIIFGFSTTDLWEHVVPLYEVVLVLLRRGSEPRTR